MALSATGIVAGQGARAAQLSQFYDLLTGIMTDQPVTLKNILSLGGNQSVGSHLLTLTGVASQTGDYLRVMPDGAVTPIFQIDSDGVLNYDLEINLKQIVTPTAPSEGCAIYSKAGGGFYTRPVGGAEAEVATASNTLTMTAKTLTSPVLTTPTIADFTSATHDHSSDAEGGAGVGEIEASVTGTVGAGDFTSTTTATIPSCSKLLWVSINGLIKSGATRTNATTIAYNETRVAGDVVVIKYVAS